MIVQGPISTLSPIRALGSTMARGSLIDSRWPTAITLAVLLFHASAAAAAAEGPPRPGTRPKIGLALSGGGARGAAHIGVLKVLEEHNIPIDCIAGSSMGAIVSGLYAYGISIEELESAITRIDWIDAFSDKIPRQDRSFRRKRDDDTHCPRHDFHLPFHRGQMRHEPWRGPEKPEAEAACLWFTTHDRCRREWPPETQRFSRFLPLLLDALFYSISLPDARNKSANGLTPATGDHPMRDQRACRQDIRQS